jgi:hypothetical protein
MHRGIVISPDFYFLPDGNVFFESAVDQYELRKYLLYWDKIEVPLTKMVRFECRDFDFLMDTGILQRTPCSLYNVSLMGFRDSYKMTLQREAGIEILHGHEHVFHQLCNIEPGVWSKAQMSNSLMSKNEVERECIEIELYNSIPIPNVETPLNDILEFKLKRKDELIAFRIHLDDLYQKIISSADIPRAKITELERLEAAIKDVYKVLNESSIKVAIRSMKSVISGVDGIIGVAVGVATPNVIPFFSISPLIAGTAAAGISVVCKMIMHSHDTIPKEFTYLKSINREIR